MMGAFWFAGLVVLAHITRTPVMSIVYLYGLL